jgi:hypothetical protein
VSIGIFFHANVNPTAKLAIRTVTPVMAKRHRDQAEAAGKERACDDPLLGEPILQGTDREDPEKHADPARADHVGE